MSRFATDKLRPGVYSAEITGGSVIMSLSGEVREETVVRIVCDPTEAHALLNYLRGEAQIVVAQGIENGERLIRLGDDDDGRKQTLDGGTAAHARD